MVLTDCYISLCYPNFEYLLANKSELILISNLNEDVFNIIIKHLGRIYLNTKNQFWLEWLYSKNYRTGGFWTKSIIFNGTLLDGLQTLDDNRYWHCYNGKKIEKKNIIGIKINLWKNIPILNG